MNGLRLIACLAVAACGVTFQWSAAAQAAAPPPAAATPPEVPPPPDGPPPAAPAPSAAPAAAVPPPADPAPKIDLSTPPPSPSIPRTYHMHEGFYARGSLGFSVLGAGYDDGNASESLNGWGVGAKLDIMVGGSPSPGVAIGGAISGGGGSVELERGSIQTDRGMSVFTVGPFVDAFFSANDGWHMGAMLAYARANIEKDTGGQSHSNGFGGAIWFGNDFWVADEWSFGPLLSVSGSLTNETTAFATTLSFTGLYH